MYRYGIYDPAFAGEQPGAVKGDFAGLAQRRLEARVKTSIEGRVLIEPNIEEACRIIDISAVGVAVSCARKPKMNSKAVFYFDLLGRFEGRVVREIDSGFATALSLSVQKQEQLGSRIEWLVKNPDFVSALKRRHFRFSLSNTRVNLRSEKGEDTNAEILTISISGVGVKSRLAPPVSEIVTLGETRARVVRHFPGGFAAEFLRLIPLEKISESITL